MHMIVCNSLLEGSRSHGIFNVLKGLRPIAHDRVHHLKRQELSVFSEKDTVSIHLL